MAAAKEKSSSRWLAWLAPILFLLAAVAAAPSAPASMTRAIETRAWEKTSASTESRPVESPQLLNLHQQNEVAGYDDALGSPLAAESEASNYENLVKQAQEAYPNKTGTEFHHITPQYLGGPANGPTVEIPSAYHQQITNAFRQIAPYGKDYTGLSAAERQAIMNQVYSKFPLPPGTQY